MSADLFVAVRAGDLELAPQLGRLVLDEQRSRPTQLTLSLADPDRVFGAALREGLELEVELGTEADHPLVFRGAITMVTAGFDEAACPTVEIVAYDRGMRLGNRQRSRRWTGTLRDLLKRLADEHGFAGAEIDLPRVPDFGETGRRQHAQSDLDFLLTLADEHNAELSVVPAASGDRLTLRSHLRIVTGTPSATVAWGTASTSRLLSFEGRSDGRDVTPAPRLTGTDGRTGQAISASASWLPAPLALDEVAIDDFARFHAHSPSLGDQLEDLVDAAEALLAEVRSWSGGAAPVEVPGFTSPAELKKRAENLCDVEPLGMEGDGQAAGAPIHAGTAVKILGVNGRFSGVWFVTSARHTVDGQGHLVDFQCVR